MYKKGASRLINRIETQGWRNGPGAIGFSTRQKGHISHTGRIKGTASSIPSTNYI